MDTIVLYGPDGREESFPLPAGPMELVEPVIDEIIQHPANAWADRYEFYSHGSQVDQYGFPVYADD
ncbi:hypothetical protein [Pseudomonas fluorescens group sp. PF-69]